MSRRSVSRDHFRGLFALYAFAAEHSENHDGAARLLHLFISSQSISDDLLDYWADRADAIGSETLGHELGLRAHAVADGNSNYDHASAFLHALLKSLDQRPH
ncbi:hypothetical protein ACFQZO_24040 [Bradyrhizobium sp. GCM10027634]|uniref:hypothetical protein n=1 Tax=unclassified Bradyrhizobium TaxID=2631580 RepID=UPI00188C167C|nr:MULTISPECIES: hypothetical protein [unclassified Bradyrhizobium]MDN5003912.1 hypothetical protein [Bradyrhizobium sp. WYCCWR 12677]QOZ45427.1 hypothetical protein XH89_19510 [Bradyrhizobium sp. CCBAU 53340]